MEIKRVGNYCWYLARFRWPVGSDTRRIQQRILAMLMTRCIRTTCAAASCRLPAGKNGFVNMQTYERGERAPYQHINDASVERRNDALNLVHVIVLDIT
jgi:hypothetical protein